MLFLFVYPGPGCSEAAKAIAGVAKHFNTVTVSYSAEALELSNRDEFRLFFRTVPQISQNGYATSFINSVTCLCDNWWLVMMRCLDVHMIRSFHL